MIQATGKGPDGNDLLIIGLSHGNLNKFRDGPLDSYIKIIGSELGLPFDVIIFSGKTEADMAAIMSQSFGPDTKVRIDDRLKS